MSSRAEPTQVDTTDRIESIAAEWDALVDRTLATPFQRPGWIAAWWSAFGSGSLRVVCAWRESRLVGILPLAAHGRRLSSPTNSESFAFGPVAEDEEATRALLDAVMSQRARRISMAYLDGERTALTAWRRAGDAAGYRLVVRVGARSPSVIVDGDWAAYQAGLARSLRSDLRRCRRRLAELGELSVARSESGAGARDALGDLLRLEAAGWKGEQATAIASRPAAATFYRSVTDWAAERRSLRVFSLRLDGRPLAVLYALEEGGHCYAMKSGYDPEMSRFSPGKLLLAGLVEHAFAAGLARVELLGVDDPYKLRWSNGYRDRLALDAFSRSPAALPGWLAEAYGRPLGRALRVRRIFPRDAAGRPR